MKSIIQYCLRDIRGYTPVSIVAFLEEKAKEPHCLFEVKGAYLHIGIKQKTMQYKTLESFNGAFENLQIIKTIASFYGIVLQEDIEPHLSDFISRLQTTDFNKPPIYLASLPAIKTR